jgi:hypothetical protein
MTTNEMTSIAARQYAAENIAKHFKALMREMMDDFDCLSEADLPIAEDAFGRLATGLFHAERAMAHRHDPTVFNRSYDRARREYQRVESDWMDLFPE